MKLLALTIDGHSITGAGSVPTGGYTTTGLKVINTGLTLLIISAIILALVFLIWGGFDWMTSEGNKQKLDQARQKVVFSIIGMMVVFISYLIVNILFHFFTLGGYSR